MITSSYFNCPVFIVIDLSTARPPLCPMNLRITGLNSLYYMKDIQLHLNITENLLD